MGSKSRTFYGFHPNYLISSDGGKTWGSSIPTKVPMGTQITESEGHRRAKNGAYYEGGPFYTSYAKWNFPTKHFDIREKGAPLWFQGNIGTPFFKSHLPSKYNLSPIEYRSKDTSDLDKYGTSAISIVNPTNPNANLAVSLGEVTREGLPSLPGIHTWKKRTETYRALGSEFLNTVFGWLPLVDEVTNTAQSIRDGRTILENYNSNSGKNVRREFAFPDDDIEIKTGNMVLQPSAHLFSQTGWTKNLGVSQFQAMPVTQSVRIQTKRWFSGAFTYAVPSRGDAWENCIRSGSEADKLFGITITPDVLWELTPWSWAVDWFTNAGDVISNVNAFALAGLVMRYGYVMEERTTTITQSFDSVGDSKSLSVANQVPASSFELRSKVRRPANPFGFGVTFEGLSPLQTAISVALGLTKL